MTTEEIRNAAKGGKICALTGHRNLKGDIAAGDIEEKIELLISQGYTLFLCGMALGFDTECCRILYSLRKKYDIGVIACIPFSGQEFKFSPLQKEIYRQYVDESDGKVILSPYYKTGCYFERNRFMVDACDALLAYLREEKGGTYYTVKYAKSKNKNILYV